MLLAEVARVARSQHGIITRAQLIELGMDASRIQRELSSGRLELVHAGVYRIAGAPRTWPRLSLPPRSPSVRSARRRTAPLPPCGGSPRIRPTWSR